MKLCSAPQCIGVEGHTGPHERSKTRHDVRLTYIDGKRELLIDGEHVQGVRSTRVTLDSNDIPHVVVELIPATLTVIGDTADVELEQPIIWEQ